jgi:formylglycine-generating enzyme required for sulfatase activity
MKRMLSASLFLLLVLAMGCGPSPETVSPGEKTPEATVEFKTPLPQATEAQVVPTPTPVPPPPTPTPIPTPTPAPEATEGPAAPAVTDIMVEIPAGPFTMGNDAGADDEAPAHEVDLPAFEIDKFEVTNADFAQFVEATGHQTDAEKAGLSRIWRDAAEGKDNHPVVYVSWNDAVAYCEWVGKRLPTEAEWEKAARGTDGRIYAWGNDYEASKLNGKDSGLRGTVAVGSFSGGASPYGAEDMAGNVWEWTADWYEAYPGSSFQSPYYGGQYRVLRGGGWFETAEFVRTTTRNATSDTAPNDDLGFRCAR